MASAGAKFDDREWQAFFNQFRKGFDWAKLLQTAFMTAGFADIQDHFKEEKGENGKWQERSYFTDYNYEKIRMGKRKVPEGIAKRSFNLGNKILQLTGDLRKSLLRTAGDNIKKLRPTSIMVFSNVPYSRIHDNGGPFKAWGKHNATMPKRDFMWLSSSGKSKMAEIIMNLAIK